MKKRYIGWLIWLMLAGCLYFFENNTGTRIVLACSLLLPVIPVIRRRLFAPDEVKKQSCFMEQNVKFFCRREEDEPGDVREYLPGDPVNRIHWKLSAKRDELLVRESAREEAAQDTTTVRSYVEALPSVGSGKKRVFLTGFSVILLAVILLFAIPSARLGFQALSNRLFEASEAVNAYAYDWFPVSAEQSVVLASLMLSVILADLLIMTILSGSRVMALSIMAGCVLFQVYYGLAFPAWLNVVLFSLFAIWMVGRRWTHRNVLPLLAGVGVLALAVLLIWPGVDMATEEASEKARDRLSAMAYQITGAVREMPAGENETRHVHTQSLTAGDREARTEDEYRLVTVEEEQISMPHWINYLKIILLLLLAVALVILPFLPFLLLNARRKKALDARSIFQSEQVSKAVCAIFQQVISWLEATGNGAGNLPYTEWASVVSERITAEYAGRFDQCSKLFEEAAYSSHSLQEDQRQQTLALLAETEEILLAKADWKQKLRLKYKECLWV